MKAAPRMLLGSMGIIASVVALGGVVHSATWDINLPVHDVTDLANAWELATHGGMPLSVDWVERARTQFDRIASAGNSTIMSPSIFPVVSFEASDAAEVHRRAMALQMFITSVSRYRSSGNTNPERDSANGELLQQLPWKTRVAHLELLVIEAISFLESDTRPEKCVHLARMDEHAASLGWKPSNATETSPVANVVSGAEIPSGWRGLEASANNFYARCAASQNVLRKVCSLIPSVSGNDLETVVKNALEVHIQDRFFALAAEVGSALESPAAELSSLERASAVNVPTKELFALGKMVQDTATLVAYVSNDDSGLEKGSSPWIAQAKAAEERAVAETKNRVGGEANRIEASNELAKTVSELRQITAKLREIGSLSGLPSDVATCRTLTVSDTPTPAQNLELVSSIDSCLGAIGRAYSELKTLAERDPNAPAFREFGSKVSGLSQTIAAVARQQTP